MTLNTKKDFAHRQTNVNTFVYGKVPPQAPEIEQAVLGAIMLEKYKLYDVMQLIYNEQCFYSDAHQKIYASIQRLCDKGMPVDLLTVAEELRKSNDLEGIGGAYYLTSLTMSVVSSAHVEAHARIVMEKYLQRELIRISGETHINSYEDSADVFDLMDCIETQLFELSRPRISRQVSSIGTVVSRVLVNIDEIRATDHDLTGVPSGFQGIDKSTNGWQSTDLIILAARPSIGKTALALNLAYNAATDKHKPTPAVIFNLEMGDMQLGKRMLATAAGIPLEKISKPKGLMQPELEALIRTGARLASLGVYVDDTPALSTMLLKSKARRLIKKHGIGLIILDYLQLMTGERAGNREQEISKISRELKVLAKELNVPIIALSQLNRDIEKRANKEPGLADLRESGAIEQDADAIFFLYKPSEEAIKEDAYLGDKILLTCKKHRNGDLFDAALTFDKNTQRFSDVNQFSNPFAGIKTDLPF